MQEKIKCAQKNVVAGGWGMPCYSVRGEYCIFGETKECGCMGTTKSRCYDFCYNWLNKHYNNTHKCQRVNGEVYPCIEFNSVFDTRGNFGGKFEAYSNRTSYLFSFCPFCGVNICGCEVDVEVSGNTWVVRFNGEDLICLNPSNWFFEDKDVERLVKYFNRGDDLNIGVEWEYIDKIESAGITDEIAIFRPIVLWGKNIDILCRVRPDGCFVLDYSHGHNVRLARVNDLKKRLFNVGGNF